MMMTMTTMTTIDNQAFVDISRQQVTRSIRSALSYLALHIHADGRYDYSYDPVKRCARTEYNLLRHAGTTMELYRFVGSEFDDGSLGEAAEKTWEYLRQFITPVIRYGKVCACLANSDVAKLGGTALTLLALCTRTQKLGVTTTDNILADQLARYLVSQHLDDGHFVSKASVSTNGPIPFESVYYAGEAVLALCAAYRLTRENLYIEHAIRGALALIACKSESKVTVERYADHWLMKALAELHLLTSDPDWTAQLRQMAIPMLAMFSETSQSLNSTHWLVNASTTGISTRIEALLSALSVELPSDDTRYILTLREFVKAGLTICLDRQVGLGHVRFDDPMAQGGFIQSRFRTDIRIDYIHHPLGACLTFLSLLPTLGAIDLLDSRAGDMTHGKSTWQAEVPAAAQILKAVAQSEEQTPCAPEKLQGTGMYWSPERQIFFHDDQVFIHEGTTNTAPSHDLAHLLLAKAGGVLWLPGGDPEAVRIAEYNAVFLEHLFDRTYNSVAYRATEPWDIVRQTLEYARWFVEQHYAPFPLPAEEAYRQFCWSINREEIARLSPVFFEQKRKERQGPFKSKTWKIHLSSLELVAADHEGSAFQALADECLGIMTSGMNKQVCP
jgi:hypothetical protein